MAWITRVTTKATASHRTATRGTIALQARVTKPTVRVATYTKSTSTPMQMASTLQDTRMLAITDTTPKVVLNLQNLTRFPVSSATS